MFTLHFRTGRSCEACHVNRVVRRAIILRLFLLFGGLAALSPLRAAPSPDVAANVDSTRSPDSEVFAQNRRLGRGVNIIGYDPLWRDPGAARFKQKHFRLLKEAGFDAVRINLHPFRAMSRGESQRLPDVWLQTLDWAIRETQIAGLLAILDMHEFNAIGDDPVGKKDLFLAFWRQLAAHCQDAPDSVLFELLNEPSRKLTPELWNAWLREALSIVREQNPRRTVIIGPANWNAIDSLPKLVLPQDDRHLIVTVHYYAPMEFTHQGASWTQHKDKQGIAWLGSPAELARIERDFAKAAAWAKEQGRPIFLGEFGTYDKAPMESRVRYTTAVARAAERQGWSWAYWQFDSDFILYDIPRDCWVEPIRDALILPRATVK